MIKEIEEIIVSMVENICGYKEHSIYFNNIIDENMVPVPYAQIFYEEGILYPFWDREIRHGKNKIRHKYDVEQNMNIIFVDNIKTSIYSKIEIFLKNLPQYIYISNQRLEIIPNKIEYKFLQGVLDRYFVILKIKINYPIIFDHNIESPIENICIKTHIKIHEKS